MRVRRTNLSVLLTYPPNLNERIASSIFPSTGKKIILQTLHLHHLHRNFFESLEKTNFRFPLHPTVLVAQNFVDCLRKILNHQLDGVGAKHVGCRFGLRRFSVTSNNSVLTSVRFFKFFQSPSSFFLGSLERFLHNGGSYGLRFLGSELCLS